MLNYTQKHPNFARKFTQKHPKFYNYVPVNKSGQKKLHPRFGEDVVVTSTPYELRTKEYLSFILICGIFNEIHNSFHKEFFSSKIIFF